MRHISLITLIFLGSFLFLGRVYKNTVTLYSVGDDDFYWSFPRSLVYDGDFRFDNEPLPTFQSQPGSVNFASPFPGLLWTPSVILGRIVTPLIRSWPDSVENGFTNGVSTYHRLLVSAFSGGLTLLGMFCLYHVLLRFVSPQASFIATLIPLLATPLFYYTFRRPLMSHSAEFLTLTAYALASVRLFENPNMKRALLAGFLGALAVGVRYPNGFVVASWFIALWLSERPVRRPGAWLFGLFAGISLPIIFQVWEWSLVRGTALPTAGIYSLSPTDVGHLMRIDSNTFLKFLNLFVGPAWGLFWIETPIILALAASFRIPSTRAERMIPMLAVGLIPILLIAANFPNQGDSFAYRYLLAKVFWLSLCLGLLWDRLAQWRFRNVLFSGTLLFPILTQLLFESGPDTLTLTGVDGGWSNPRFAWNALQTLVTDPLQIVFSAMGTPLGHLLLCFFAKLGLLSHVPSSIAAKAMTRIEMIPLLPFGFYIFSLSAFTGAVYAAITLFRRSAPLK